MKNCLQKIEEKKCGNNGATNIKNFTIVLFKTASRPFRGGKCFLQHMDYTKQLNGIDDEISVCVR